MVSMQVFLPNRLWQFDSRCVLCFTILAVTSMPRGILSNCPLVAEVLYFLWDSENTFAKWYINFLTHQLFNASEDVLATLWYLNTIRSSQLKIHIYKLVLLTGQTILSHLTLPFDLQLQNLQNKNKGFIVFNTLNQNPVYRRNSQVYSQTKLTSNFQIKLSHARCKWQLMW